MERRVSQDAKGMLRDLELAHLKNETLKEVSDVEWDIRVKDWEKERQGWMRQMVENSVWAMGAHPSTKKEEEVEAPLTSDQMLTMLGPRNLFGLDPQLLHGIQSEMSNIAMGHGLQQPQQSHATGQGPAQSQTRASQKKDQTKSKSVSKQASAMPKPTGSPSSGQQPQPPQQPHQHHHHHHPHSPQIHINFKTLRVLNLTKHKKMTRLELLQLISDWDKASFGKRDMMILDFTKIYRTRENIYDSDALFHCGGSLIFCRFCISLQMCFLKHRKVWHYFDALSIFVKSLQGDRYTEEFLRLGGLGFICEVIRIEGSGQADKLHACKFLVDMMKGRNSIAVKMFICDNPHFLESLVDSLTMCKDKKLVAYCGLCFENLCLEARIPNVMVVTSYVMRLLPCDFNPVIQSMAFRVLQSVVRLKPSVGAKCVKPILDNLKTDDMDLLVEMSNLSQTILQTKYGPELIDQLMFVAEGIHLREEFKSIFRPHMRRFKGQSGRDQGNELRKAREKHERVKQKMSKFDHYMQQAGALFVINRMMTNKIEFVDEFTKHGVFGLSLKTLGSSPHWEVQGQGVTMVQFLRAMSVECAISYYLMLPERMIRLIVEKPAECLRYFTAPICVLLRKLGRFALRLWNTWLQKVVIPAKEVSEDGTLPDYFFDMCKMTRKVAEIQMALHDLLEHPVMESYSKSDETTMASGLPLTHSSEEEDESNIIDEFISDDDDTFDYRTGKELLFEGRTFRPFNEFLDFQAHLSDDKLDIKVDKSQPSVVLAGSHSNQNELSALEQTLLQDAENKKPVPTVSATTQGHGQGPEEHQEPQQTEGGNEDD